MKAQVLLPKVFNFPFTYNSKTGTKIGSLVEVPFGSKKEIGVIWKNNYSEPKNIKIKDITNKTNYSINRKLVDFIEWFASYNMVPIGFNTFSTSSYFRHCCLHYNNWYTYRSSICKDEQISIVSNWSKSRFQKTGDCLCGSE